MCIRDRPGKDAITRQLDGGIAFDIAIDQKTNPGLKGTLRIEARPWT